MDEYRSRFSSTEIDNGVQKGLDSVKAVFDSLRLTLGLQYGGYDTSEITNPEWSNVLVDSEDKILAGIKVDGSLFIAEL